MLRIPRRLQIALGLSLALALGSTTEADSPSEGPIRLVHDFFPGEFFSDGAPPQFAKLGNALFFVADDLDTGRGVWRTDGTPAGTGRVPVAGAPEGDADLRILGHLGTRMLWMTNAAGALNAWVLVSAGRRGDGTVLAAFTPRFNGYEYVGMPVKVGQRFFFEDCTEKECAFRSTDGTSAGTGPVPALASFTKADQPILGAFAGRWLVFRSENALYAYDVPRDRVLLLLPRGARGPYGAEMYPVGDTLFLLTRDDAGLSRLWISRLSTPRAAQIFQGKGLDIAGWRGDRLYLISGNGKLWSTDGRSGGTRRYSHGRFDSYAVLADRLSPLGPISFFPVRGYYSEGLYAADENRLMLQEILHTCSGRYNCMTHDMSGVATAGNQGFLEIDGSLWQSDGTPAGTKPHEILGRTDAGTFRVVGDRLILGATSRKGEEQLWETDGTAAGTRALSDPEGGPFHVQAPPVPFAGALYTSAIRNPVGQQLWRVADGRATPITDLRHEAVGLEPSFAFPVGDRLVLKDSHDSDWIGLSEDGSIEKLPLVYEGCRFNPCPFEGVAVGERLLLDSNGELWSTDGTAAGTGTIPLELEGEEREIVALGRLKDRALALDQSGGLWTSDGSTVHHFAQLPKAPDVERPMGLPLALGPLTLLFCAVPADTGHFSLELWRTDGTAAGTLKLASLPFDREVTPSVATALLEGRLFFQAMGVLWVSDGSAAGTHPVKDAPGAFSMAAGTKTLYAAQGNTLWAIDPKTLQSSRIGTFSSLSGDLRHIVGNTLLFSATDENGAGSWWVAEGTSESTRPVPEPLESLSLYSLVPAGNRHYFSFCDPEHGCELWSTDRLGQDIGIVQDLWPGPRGSHPQILKVTEDALWLVATEPSVGRELWKIDLSQEKP